MYDSANNTPMPISVGIRCATRIHWAYRLSQCLRHPSMGQRHARFNWSCACAWSGRCDYWCAVALATGGQVRVLAVRNMRAHV